MIPDIGRSLFDQMREEPMLNPAYVKGLSEPDTQNRTRWVDPGYQYRRRRIRQDGVGLGSRGCGKADRADDAPVPGPFGAALDDKAKRIYVDVASGKMRAERVNDGLGGLADDFVPLT
jgi:hypothetical protein